MRDIRVRNVTERIVKNLADIDYYKLTMLQFIHYFYPDTVVKFQFQVRSKIDLTRYIDLDELKRQLERMTYARFPKWCIRALKRRQNKHNPIFRDNFLDWLETLRLSMPNVYINEHGQIEVSVTGTWMHVMLWETITMCIVNRLYKLARMRELGLNEKDVLAEGMRLTKAKLARLDEQHISFIDFSTRRRHSYEHQVAIIKEAMATTYCCSGTSNVLIGLSYGYKLSGTMAHELPMAFQAIFWNEDEQRDRLVSQKILWRMWETFYEGRLTIALTDTYGNDFGLQDFEEFAFRWDGSRHDSGDPFKYGEDVIAFYERMGIDPKKKILVFSDGLTVEMMIYLWNRFHNRIIVAFGWGTHFGNDMGCGLEPISIVMKLIAVLINGSWIHTGKITDNRAKATGPTATVDRLIEKTGGDRSCEEIACVV